MISFVAMKFCVYDIRDGHRTRRSATRSSKLCELTVGRNDLTELSAQAAQQQMQDELQLDARIRFDLSREPLMRAMIYSLPDNKQVIYLNIHHIVCDGWSVGLFGRELSTIYADRLAGRTTDTPTKTLQYADYSLWQRTYAKFDSDERLVNAWRELLVDFEESLQLPTDNPRPDSLKFEGRTHYFDLPETLCAQLVELSRKRGTTLFNVLNAAWQILLARTSGQNDFCIGTPASGRARNGLRRGIWLFHSCDSAPCEA